MIASQFGAVFGLTPSRDQSGERDRPGAQHRRCGDEMMRMMLYEAAQACLTAPNEVVLVGLGDEDR